MRLRRLRGHEKLRALMRETALDVNDFIYPLFIKHGLLEKNPIQSMPGQYQLGISDLKNKVQEIQALGIPAVILFGIPAHKDERGTGALDANGIIPAAISEIKQHAPNLLVISDLCYCEYTSHGHCGAIIEQGGRWVLDNDATLEMLVAQSLVLVRAGADVIAPSGMIDGMVAAIRQGLDLESYTQIPILSYAAKYASALYAPFREAAEGAPQFGDRKSYQMDPANSKEALREVDLDVQEGADMLMVKPASYYLDIIYQTKSRYPEVPLVAYQVGGEYAMIKAAAQLGWLDEQKTALEALLSIKRAGSDAIITLYAMEAARWLE